MTPFFFGPLERRLFGIFQPAQTAGGARAAALFCNPLGQEAIRTHRLYRVLADRLALAGFDVMRFDYFGTGDAAGDDVDGELEGWGADVAAAHAELLSRSRAQRNVWMGARLGATIAAGATVRLDQPLHRLVLWEPILDGLRYQQEVSTLHRLTLEASFAGGPNPWPDVVATDPQAAEREYIGFDLGPALRMQLSALTPALAPPRAVHCTLIERDDDAAAPLVEAWKRTGLHANTAQLKQNIDWSWQQPRYSGLVPGEALELLVDILTAAP